MAFTSVGDLVDLLDGAFGELDAGAHLFGPEAELLEFGDEVLLICMNSPESVSRLNILEICGSMHS